MTLVEFIGTTAAILTVIILIGGAYYIIRTEK
jgi:hypothetical protein